MNLRVVLGGRRRNERAITAIEAAAEAYPKYLTRPMYHEMRGGSEFEAGPYAESVSSYERVLELPIGTGGRWTHPRVPGGGCMMDRRLGTRH